MLRDIKNLSNKEYDLLVIGGGINGAAISFMAADCGMQVALLEKNDFASGTSSKSTKLIHGGIRYLENFEFGLVRESLRERYIQLKAAPHLVKPIKFVIPVYKGDKRPLWLLRLGVYLYDKMAGKYAIGRHKGLSIDEILQWEPKIKREGLQGAVMYYDCQMDDARLCLENILSAAEKGAEVANYTEAVSFLKAKGRATGVRVRDNLTGNFLEVRAKNIVCAVGPWANILLKLDEPTSEDKVRTTKGIHLVYSQQLSQNALLIPSSRDERIFFVIPWRGNSLIGTTDTDYDGSPDKVKADSLDIDYLWDEAKRVFPSIEFNKSDIIATFASLRPLLRKGGSPSKVSRRHVIFNTSSGIVFVIGGKYTTYRKIAFDCVSRLIKVNPKKEFLLYGSGVILEEPQDIARNYALDLGIIEQLIANYGARYKDVLELTEKNPQFKERILPQLPLIKAQLIYALKNEAAQTAEDIIFRRLSLGYLAYNSKELEEEANKAIRNFLAKGDKAGIIFS